MKTIIKSAELVELLDGTPAEFPKYVTQIINLANQNAGGTRPRIVGQQTELIQEFPGHTLSEWQEWYLERHPNAITEATDRIYAMVQRLHTAIEQIDRVMIEKWVRDLVLVKTFAGLRFQPAILMKVAELKGESYRFATTAEEAIGIDGYIGERPVSVKPHTYRTKALPERIEVEFIYYQKVKDGISIEYDF